MIIIFGASVTQQKDGFASIIQKKLRDEVLIYGYGGMHLDDASIIYINNIVRQKPNYCLIDFFSTGYNDISKKTTECIKTIIYKLISINCIPCFLFFPSKDYNYNKSKFYSFCKEQISKYNVPFIDISNEFDDKEINLILRDNVHTTKLGSDIYASKIIEKLAYVFDYRIINILKPECTRYLHIRKLPINREIYDYLCLTGKSEIVGMELMIGPCSGLIEVVRSENRETKKIKIWDKWCHYYRRHFNFKGFEIDGIVRLKVIGQQFDISNCKIKVNFHKIRKRLIIYNIYYVGKSLDIANIGETVALNKHKYILYNSLSRVRKKAYDKLYQIKNSLTRRST